MGGLGYFILGFVSALVLVAAAVIITTIGWFVSYSKYKQQQSTFKVSGKSIKVPKKPPWVSHTDKF